MEERYAEPQFVGIDLHRRRSVVVRMAPDGETLEKVRVSNGVESFRAVMERAGEHPEVALEATYGWFWLADLLTGDGARMHLAHPLAMKGLQFRRVKSDVVDATGLADLLRMGRLPEAWIAPPATRELRELVRHRAKLVGLRTGLKCQVHAVLAAHGAQAPVSDVFGVQGHKLVQQVALPAAFRARVNSADRLIAALDFEVATFEKLIRNRLRRDRGYLAVQTIPKVNQDGRPRRERGS